MSNPLAGLKTKGEMVSVDKIDVNTFVRDTINPGRLELLQLAVESDVKLPPIVLVPSYEVFKGEISPLNDGRFAMVDGRHRLWVYKNTFDQDEVSAIIVTGIKTESQLISIAFQLNAPDGPLPPDKKDIEHTVTELLKRRVAKKEIPNLLGLPDVAVRKYINDVEARLQHSTTLRAYSRVVKEGMSIPDAASAEGTTPEKLRNYIAAGRRKRKQGDVDAMNTEIARLFKSLLSSLHMLGRNIGKKFADGDVTSDDGVELYDKLEKGLSKATKVVDDLANRFIAKAEGGENGGV